MKNEMFLALLFGLVTLGFAEEPSNDPVAQASNYLNSIGMKGENDKLSKQEINIPYIQGIVGGPETEIKKLSDDGLDGEIKGLLQQLLYNGEEEHKKEDKPSEYEEKKEHEKPEHAPKKDNHKAIQEALQKKFAKLFKIESSLKHTVERHHKREFNREKVAEVRQEKEKPAEEKSPEY